MRHLFHKRFVRDKQIIVCVKLHQIVGSPTILRNLVLPSYTCYLEQDFGSHENIQLKVEVLLR